jgi:hypothetical protein
MNSEQARRPVGPWIVQDLGAREDYPAWRSYCIRDKVTNVHIATVGAVDRYFEGHTDRHARIMAAAPELLRACIAALVIVLREQPDGSIADDMIKAIRKAEGKD